MFENEMSTVVTETGDDKITPIAVSAENRPVSNRSDSHFCYIVERRSFSLSGTTEGIIIYFRSGSNVD